jgi:hypothetical protein
MIVPDVNALITSVYPGISLLYSSILKVYLS